jgi:2-aminoethylphosphonate-pyruvate transaminase
MVDMSTTLIHNGHIRLLKKASEYGDVVVGLTTDEEILAKKGYQPELSFEQRKELLEALSCVSEVVATPWLIDQTILDCFKIDILVHGDDNSNPISKDRLILLPRTPGISSMDLRNRATKSLTQINNQKLMLTPGPAVVLHENILNLKPLFGRGDDEYTLMAEKVVEWVGQLSGQDEVIFAQGSATFGLELALHSFVSGNILLVSTGYYSDRLKKLLPFNCDITVCKYEDLEFIHEKFDWILCAYTETSIAFKLDLKMVRNKADSCGARLFVDATGSIGLEDHHELADLMAFSSCKGLFGLTGACFIAHKQDLVPKDSNHFYFNIDTHKKKMVTGPYHAIASLYGVIENHSLLRQRVINSKKHLINKYKDIARDGNQPLLCTYLEGRVVPIDDNVVLYSPRSELSGSVVCHLGEIHHDVINIDKRIKILC